MATVTCNPSRHLIYADLNVSDRAGSADSTNNTTIVDWNVVIRRGSVGWDTSWTSYGQNIYATIDITGLGSKNIYIPTYNYNGQVTPGSVVASGSFTIGHNDNGTKSIDFGISFTDNANGHNGSNYYTPGNASRAGSSMTLQTVPRYATSNQSLNTKTETSIKMNWSSDNTIDYVWYSTNNGANWTAVGSVNATSGTYTISNLSAGTNYQIKTRVRRKDSQLTTDSGKLDIATYSYPYLTSVPEFTVGNSLTIGIYNPLGRSCTISVIGDNSAEHNGGTITGTSISPFNNDGWKNIWYSTLSSKTQGTYKVRLKCSTGNVNQVSGAVKYYLNTSDSGFKPTFTANEVINIVNTANTDIAGSNKFIKNHNSLSGTIKPMTAQRSATGSYYNVSASGLTTVRKDYSSSNINFVLGNMSTNAFNITAVDSRGFSTTISKTIDLVDYSKPSVTSAKITRQNGIGTKAILAFSGKYTNWSGLLKTNAIQSIKYKIGSSGSWTALPSDATLTSSNGTWTLNAILTNNFAVTSQYDLYLQITDLLETVTVGSYVISTADAFVWKDLANKRIGVGKKPDYTLDVKGDINATGNVRIKGNPIIPSNVITSKTGVNGKSHYYHICHIKKLAHNQGNMYGIRVYEGNGNNGGADQNTYTEIIFQDGWTGSVSGRPGVTCEYHGLLTSVYKREIVVTYSDDHNYDVWVKGISVHTRPNYIPMYNPQYVEITDTSTESSETLPSGVNKLNVSVINSGLAAYPVGSIYISATPTNPQNIFGGTWVQLKNHFLFATNATSGNKGKDAVSSHTGTNVSGTAISVDQMPSHNHGGSTGNAGGHKHEVFVNGDEKFPLITYPGWAGGQNGQGTSVQNSYNGFRTYTGDVANHKHTIGSQGGGKTHNHSVSYIEVYVWQRTA